MFCVVVLFFFLFKQKTAYEMRISDWSSDVCSSDLGRVAGGIEDAHVGEGDLVVAVGRAVAAPAGKGIIGHGSGSPFQQGHVVVSLRQPSSSREAVAGASIIGQWPQSGRICTSAPRMRPARGRATSGGATGPWEARQRRREGKGWSVWGSLRGQ